MVARKNKLEQPALDEVAPEPELSAAKAPGASGEAPTTDAKAPSAKIRPFNAKPRAESTASRSPSLPLAPGDVIEPPSSPGGSAATIRDRHLLDDETLIPVHGMVRLSEREMDVIDHPRVPADVRRPPARADALRLPRRNTHARAARA